MPTPQADTVTYLDYAATTPLLPAAREALLAGLALWANPSSPHGPGRKARAALEEARARLRAALAWDGEVVFTSGASEALAIAITQCRLPLAGVSAVEHDAVLRHLKSSATLDAVVLPVHADGSIDPSAAALPGLVAVQHVNSETGVIQALAPVAAAAREAGGLLLADCAQSAGKLALPDADLIAVAAHKFGGPIGVGALLVRDYAMLRPAGGQERGYRGGTENLPGILAMVAALEAEADWLMEATRLRDTLETAIIDAGGEVAAAAAQRIPTIGAYRMPGKSSAAQLIGFDAKGIAVSAGSACSSGSLRGSHVLKAMGVRGAAEVIRVSIGRETTAAEIDRFVAAWRAMRPAGVSA